MSQRCTSCHSKHPTDDVFVTAPNGVMFDTPEQIKGYITQIQARVVSTHNMPLANKTNMTDPERELIGRWIAQGAPIDGNVPAPPPPPPPAPTATEAPGPPVSPDRAARDYFRKKCVVCHGTTGAGDGPGASALNPKPRRFGDKSWQTSVSDEQLKKVIVGGGPAVGKSTAMPPNPDLQKKPEVVSELVRIVRGFGG
jgi:mono/diheme cytochrome c family protein